MADEENNQEKRKIKRLEIGNFPFAVGLGGKTASRDAKLIFIDKQLGKHFTLRIIKEEERGRLVFDFHSTDEKSDKHTSLLKIMLDMIALERDKEKIEKEIASLPNRIITQITNEDFLDGKVLVPIINSGLILQKKPHKTLFLDSDKLNALIGHLGRTKRSGTL